MASKNTWEYECPQFVDFCSGIEDVKCEIWCGGTSPGIVEDVFEDRKFPERVPSLALSTPIHPSANLPRLTNTTDSEKIKGKVLLSRRLSKSDGALHGVRAKVIRNKGSNFVVNKKKTRSDSEIWPRKKHPTTPLCLKRTAFKAKDKRIKTTEELELEKIAQLRKQTWRHLRSNENMMKKLKMKQQPKPLVRPEIPQKPLLRAEIPPKPLLRPEFLSNLLRAEVPPKPLLKAEILSKPLPRPETKKKEFLNNPRIVHDAVLEKINAYVKSRSSQVQKSKVMVKGPTSVVASFNRLGLGSSNETNPASLAGPSKVTDANVKQEKLATDRPIPLRRYEAHSGLSFTACREKKPVFNPFNFQRKTRIESEKSEKVKFSDSLLTPRMNQRNKENASSSKFCTGVKPQAKPAEVQKPHTHKKPQDLKFRKWM